MEDGMTASCESLWGSTEQYYECPCGKTYLSYPALFTHIKKKHAGKAPGAIKKPHSQPKRRGRPPVHFKNTCSETNVTIKTEADSSCFSDSEIQAKLAEESIQMTKISSILMELPQESIAAILEMNVFLVSRKGEEESLRIGWVLVDFLQQLSKAVGWNQFQQMYTLLMLLVQFTIDTQADPRIVSQGQVDLLCDNINAFVQSGLKQMIQQYEINHLAIFQEEVMLQLFQAFFHWLIAKKYTNYRITLNTDFIPL